MNARDHRLFSYGTLRLERVQRARFGRVVAGVADALLGWRLETVTITDAAVLTQSGEAVHPVLVRSGDPADRVDGVVLALDEAELAAADAYEVADYRRVAADLVSGGRAWVYVSAADAEADADAGAGGDAGAGRVPPAPGTR